MNISYNWLRQLIDTPDSAQEVARILTDIGLEVGTVETVESIKGGLEGLVVGQVKTCIPHPNSDHLHITTVDYGEGDKQIVCGAPNVAAGQKVVVATIGTRLYSGDESFVIKRGKIRGEESLGMLCAEDEIGVGTSHDGIIVLPENTPIGMKARDYYHIEDDTLIEVDITPNRADGASHWGVARDLYAYYRAHGKDVRLRRPDVSTFRIDNHNLPITVRIEATEACPRYTGVSISGIEVKESPDWLKKALQTIGLRSINNVVDITNYVLMETGQPLHAFDADKIKGNMVVVRKAREGERFTTLDGVERTMTAADLMICNESEPMCIAGVFGGQDSGVTDQTRNVFLESAYFEPVGIRKTARRHGLNTDASFRYERGCDPNNTLYVLQRAALLIQQVAGGTVSMEVSDNGTTTFEPWHATLNLNRAYTLIGKEIGEETIETILTALEIRFTKRNEQGDINYDCLIPRYRVDVQRECDLVEDILRIYGYNRIEFPERVHTSLSYSPKPDPIALQRRVSEQLTAQGFNEIMNNSLTRAAYYSNGTWGETCVRVKNPLSADLSVMRQVLLFGGLESIQRNVNRKQQNLRFYEFGNCYHYNSQKSIVESRKQEVEGQKPIDAYSEEPHLALWLTGNKTIQSWVRRDEKVSFYQLHAYVDAVLTRLGIATDKLIMEPAVDPAKDMSCGICQCFSDGLVLKTQSGKSLGYMVVVANTLLRQFDIDQPVYYADLYWNTLLAESKKYKPVIEDLPRFPEVKRDLALLLDKNICFADLKKAALDTERKLLKQVTLFDVYEGKNLEEGKKSYALSFVLQDANDTLKDKQIENIMQRLQKTFEDQFGAKLR
ncbi:MAG: phenylalanine--tRNA ligase subunit beta [Paludibacteraceae bacterium]|nr:phenylalanine--tRNA ligase subunit beta [Paludibacteraceae bacterium]